MSPGRRGTNSGDDFTLTWGICHYDSNDNNNDDSDNDDNDDNDDNYEYDDDLSYHNCVTNPLLTSRDVYLYTIGGDWNRKE